MNAKDTQYKLYSYQKVIKKSQIKTLDEANFSQKQEVSAKKDRHLLGCTSERLSDLALSYSSTTCVLQQVGQVKMGTFYLSQWLTFKATNQLFHRDDLYLVNCERLSADDPGEAEGEVTKHT